MIYNVFDPTIIMCNPKAILLLKKRRSNLILIISPNKAPTKCQFVIFVHLSPKKKNLSFFFAFWSKQYIFLHSRPVSSSFLFHKFTVAQQPTVPHPSFFSFVSFPTLSLRRSLRFSPTRYNSHSMRVAERQTQQSQQPMENGVADNGVCSSESVNGSRDVWSAKESDSCSADHLVVMVHGIMGRSAFFNFITNHSISTISLQ